MTKQTEILAEISKYPLSDLIHLKGCCIFTGDQVEQAMFLYAEQRLNSFRGHLVKEGYTGIATLLDEWLEKEK